MANDDGLKGMRAANNATFQSIVKYYMQKSAVSIIGELAATAGHTERRAYAVTVLNGTASVFQMATAVATNSTIIANISLDGGFGAVPDADIEFTVSSLWDDFANFEAV